METCHRFCLFRGFWIAGVGCSRFHLSGSILVWENRHRGEADLQAVGAEIVFANKPNELVG